MAGKILIGTSGFTYQHWREVFYPQNLPQRDWLKFYAQRFPIVEINASFYHQILKKTYQNWVKITPENFIFAVKGSRFITHIKRLKDCREPIERFFSQASGLGAKLGPILWQLPPQWGFNEQRLAEFLDILPKARCAFEFRDRSWFNDKVYTLLKKHNCALVIQDSSRWPSTEEITADFTYLRFHGRDSLYGSCYNKRVLRSLAEKINSWHKKIDVYGFFNNDVYGYAVKNAQELTALIED
ncbi:DUF72 domain-containing protein [Candidatus Microgenomates bacterium]|nr:DUF72 domain-containing protein [Candidatus Microgenomates bacterium]